MKPEIVNLKKFNKDTTLTVTLKITKQFKLRILVALKLIHIATWVLGCGLKIKQIKK